MTRFVRCILGISLLLVAEPLAWAVRVGLPAPDFTATDTYGKSHKLSEYKGNFVVLEWHNRDCPYTHKHYASGNMQKLQKEWTGKGVVWFTVISSAPVFAAVEARGEDAARDAAGRRLAFMPISSAASALRPPSELTRSFSRSSVPPLE